MKDQRRIFASSKPSYKERVERWKPRNNSCEIDRNCEEDWDLEECCPVGYKCMRKGPDGKPLRRPICFFALKDWKHYGRGEPIGSPDMFSSTRAPVHLDVEPFFDPFESVNGRWQSVSKEKFRELWLAMRAIEKLTVKRKQDEQVNTLTRQLGTHSIR